MRFAARTVPGSSTLVLLDRIASSAFYSPVFSEAWEYTDDEQPLVIFHSPEKRRHLEIQLSKNMGKLLRSSLKDYDLLIDFVPAGLSKKTYRIQLFATTSALARDIGQVCDAKYLEQSCFNERGDEV